MTGAAVWIMLAAAGLTGLFASIQMSLRGASRSRVKEIAGRIGTHTAGRVAPILDDLNGHAIAAALPRLIFSMTTVAAALVWSTGVGEESRVTLGALAIAAAFAVALLSIFGIVVPMSIADHVGDTLIVRLSRLIRLTRLVTAPAVRGLGVVDEIVRRLVGAADSSREEELERELLSVVSDAEHEGELSEAERRMLRAVVDFRTRTVEEVMTPRTEVVGVARTDDLLAVRALIADAGHSRIPVYDGDLDHIVGVLYVKDLLEYLGADAAKFSIDAVLRPARFVPETKPVGEMLVEFQRDKVHLAMVLDEYGGTAGLVTIEDILEEIVGEIQDEYESVDDAPPDITLVADARTLEADARASVSDVNDRLEPLGVTLPESDDYDTIGGLVTTELGRLPETGESFRKNGFVVTVLAAEPTRVTRVRVEFDSPGARAAEQLGADVTAK